MHILSVPFWKTLSIGLAVTATAAAQPCGKPDLVEAIPGDDASGIPLNARPTARYATSAQYLGEPVMFGPTGELTEAAASFNDNESLLTVTPAAALLPNTEYTLVWPELRGVNTASLGTGKTVAFTTSASSDLRSPIFSGLERLEWDLERERDDCTDTVEERFVFELTPGEIDDDASRGALSMVVFQTAGPGLAGARPILVSGVPDRGESLRVERTVQSAAGNVCFAALVRDSAGHVSAGADREVCATTTEPPFFLGCALHRTPSGRDPQVLVVTLVAGFAWRRRVAKTSE